ESYERLKDFFRWRLVELDRATGFRLCLIDVGNPETSSEFYELARSEAARIGDDEAARLFVQGNPLAGVADTHRVQVMHKLATMLAVSPAEWPCIVFVGAGRFETVARFRLESAWFSTQEARAVLVGSLRDWIANLRLDGSATMRGDRKALAESLAFELEKVR